ncbi:MAG: DUF4215 domain-containing protein [Nannocystaceae bacterium]
MTWLLPIAGCFDEGPGVDSSPQSSSSGDTTGEGTDATTGTTTLSETASGSGSESVDSGSVDSSSGTAGAPVCGDGVVAGDELCDDGNDTPGDGCSGCVPSGTVVWSYTAGTDVDDEGAEALMLRPADLVVVGGIATAGNDRDVWVQLLDLDGGAVARVTADGESQDDRAFAVAPGADGGFTVAGGVARVTPSGELWLGRFDQDATLVEESEQGSTPEFDLGLGVAPLPNGGVVVAGQSTALDADSDGWLMVFDGITHVDEVRCDCGFLGTARRVTSTPAGALASVWFEDFSWHLRGYQGAIDTMSVPAWDQSLDNVIGEVALAQAPDGNLHVCGAMSGFNDVELWWGVFSPQGDPQLDASFDLGDGDQECQALDVRGGRAVLAGTIDVGAGKKTSVVTAIDVANATPVYQAEIAIEDAGWTRVRGIAVDGDAVYVVGGYGPTEHETDAFAARLVH